MGFGPTTFALARRRTTTVLYPRLGELLFFTPHCGRSVFIYRLDTLVYIVRIVDLKDSACSLSQNQWLSPAHTTETEAEPIRNC